MDLTEAILDSWDRQARILTSVAGLVNESNRHVKPSEDGWPLDRQLAHIHSVRREWIGHLSPERSAALPETFTDGWKTPINDLDEIKASVASSGQAIREAMAEALSKPLEPARGYDNPILFLQHMVWHEGWHVGLLMLGLRNAGQEPTDEWEEENIWAQWRADI